MPAEMLRKAKAILLLAMLAGAEVSHVEQNIRLNTGRNSRKMMTEPKFHEQANHIAKHFDALMGHLRSREHSELAAEQMEAVKGDPMFQELEGFFSEQLQRMMAEPKFEQQATLITKEMEAMMNNPSLQEQANMFAKEMDTMMAEPKLHQQAKRIIEQLEAGAPVTPDQVKKIAEEMESITADPVFQKQQRRFTEQLQTMATNSDLQKQAGHVAEQVATMVSDPSIQNEATHFVNQMEDKQSETPVVGARLQKQAEQIVEQVETMFSEPNLKKQVGLVAEQVEAVTADPRFQEQTRSIAEQLEAMMEDPNLMSEANRVAEQVETLMADPSSHEQAQRVAEHFKVMIANSNFQKRSKHIVEQVKAVKDNSKLHTQANMFAEQLQKIMAEPSFQKQAALISKRVEVLMTDSNLQWQSKMLAEHIEWMKTNTVQDPGNKLANRLVDQLANKMFDRTLKAAAEPSKPDSEMKGVLALLGGILFHLAGGTQYTLGNLILYMPNSLKYWGGVAPVTPPGAAPSPPDALYVLPLTITGMMFGMPVGPMLERKIGPKYTMLIAAALMFTGVLVGSFLNRLWAFVIFYSILFGMGVGTGYQMPLITGSKWFPNKKGLIAGCIVGGFGASAFFFNMIDTAIINPHSVNAENGMFPDYIYSNYHKLLAGLAVTYGLMGAGGAFLQSKPNEAYTKALQEKLSGTQTAVASQAVAVAPANPLWKDILSVRFLLMWLMIVTSAISGLFVTGSYKAYGTTLPNLNNDAFLTLVGAFASLFGNAGGRLFWGSLSDVVGFRPAFMALTLMQTILMLGFKAFASYRATFMIATVFVLFGMGGDFAMFPAEALRAFGPNGAHVYGFMFSAFATAAILGPFVIKALQRAGGYDTVFNVFGVASGVAFVLSLLNPKIGDSHNSINNPLTSLKIVANKFKKA